MGFGLGAAIGIQVAHPDKNVVLITGDGGFLMNCNELATVKKENLPIVTVVVNDGVERDLKLKVDRDNMMVYTTTQEKQMEETYKGEKTEITLPEKGITTIIFEQKID